MDGVVHSVRIRSQSGIQSSTWASVYYFVGRFRESTLGRPFRSIPPTSALEKCKRILIILGTERSKHRVNQWPVARWKKTRNGAVAMHLIVGTRRGSPHRSVLKILVEPLHNVRIRIWRFLQLCMFEPLASLPFLSSRVKFSSSISRSLVLSVGLEARLARRLTV